ncbi:MAG: hypothetical protein E7632_09295 [Ruminococcaceae bacterium]|nr:hypothetical protein [Oscillospiraceae bacterium]
MKVFLVTDLEGVAGVINVCDYVYPESRYYELAKELLTEETNAAIDGFFAAGADEIVVQDGHGQGGINILKLDPRAKLQRGWVGPHPFGLDDSYDVMAWVGQHPKAGTEYGHICHTGTHEVLDYTINGISVGEFGKIVFLGQLYNAVPIFASGCLAFTKEAAALVEGIETVYVKEGVIPGKGDECSTEAYRARNLGAIHMHPVVARKRIREGAERALRRFLSDPESFRPTKIYPPYSKVVKIRPTNGKPGYVDEKTGYTDLAAIMNC